LKFHMWRQR